MPVGELLMGRGGWLLWSSEIYCARLIESNGDI
jgi:hypothetical protein